MTVFLGGARQHSIPQRPPDEIQQIALRDVRRLLGIAGSPAYSDVEVNPRAIPQYNVGFGRIKAAMADVDNVTLGSSSRVRFAMESRCPTASGQAVGPQIELQSIFQMEKKTGLLLINTGSPDSCSTAGVRRYLREFLMDPRVLDVPAPLRALIVYGAILPFRPARSAAAYREIWTAEGSPLVAITKRLAERLRGEMEMPVAIAMRYGSLTPARALRSSHARTCMT